MSRGRKKKKKLKSKSKSKRAFKRGGGEQHALCQAATAAMRSEPRQDGFSNVYMRGLDARLVEQRDKEAGAAQQLPNEPGTSHPVMQHRLSEQTLSDGQSVPAHIRRAPQEDTQGGHDREGSGRKEWAERRRPGKNQWLPPPEVPIDKAGPPDTRAILLFDLNGTLTSHTAARRSAGRNLMRPGIPHLRRLAEHFRLGIFTSASPRTVSQVLPMLEQAAGPGPRLFAEDAIILTRRHTKAASADHKAGGGKEWDTVKPLSKWFSRLHRVLLVDDDSYKACKGEEQNMVLMPRWEEQEDDWCLEVFVRLLLQTLDGMDGGTDLREYSAAVSRALASAHAASRSEPRQEGVLLLSE